METTFDKSNGIKSNASEYSDAISTKGEELSKLIETSVYAALETYSNVHRGSGHYSIVSTSLFEKSREIVTDYLKLDSHKFQVIFMTKARAENFVKQLKAGTFHVISSTELGLPFAVLAIAVEKIYLPLGAPVESGGGTTKLVAQDWVIWDDSPDKFEAGTPAIINIIAFARALQLLKKSNVTGIFNDSVSSLCTPGDILYNDALIGFTGKELLNQLRKTMINQPLVPTTRGLKPYINFDNSASTPTFKAIWESVRLTWHAPLSTQKEIVAEVKRICSKFLGASQDVYDTIFTSNTTEAINLVAKHFPSFYQESEEPVILTSFLEHNSNDLPWRSLTGLSIVRLHINDDGFFDLSELNTLLTDYNQLKRFGKKRIKVVALTGASNILGSCNELKEICRVAHDNGAKVLIDGAQLTAHRSINIEESGIDFYAFSAHKVYAPFGTGVLIMKKSLLNINDDDMQIIRSSGEDNAGGIAALGKALLILQRIGMDVIYQQERSLNKYALSKLSQIPGIKIYGVKDSDSPLLSNKLGVIAFSFKNRIPSKFAKELTLRRGIGIRSGCHCAHLTVKRILNIPHYIERIQWFIQTLFPKFKFAGVLRISFGLENNENEVEELVDVITEIQANGTYNKVKSNSETKNIVPVEILKLRFKEYIEDVVKRVFA